MVSVRPGAGCGRVIDSRKVSPGQGRKLRSASCASVPSATGGKPWASTCQSGEALIIQLSTQASVSGAVSVSASCGARVDTQPTLVACGARLTCACPSLTTIPAVVTDSPGSSGTCTTTGVPGGETRRTVVSTRQFRSKNKRRSTRRNGGSTAASCAFCASCLPRAARAASAALSFSARRENWSVSATPDSSDMPATSQPSACTSTRRGRSGKGNCTTSAAGRTPNSSTRERPAGASSQAFSFSV